MALALSKIYAQLPKSMIKRGVSGWISQQNITTANLRKALKMDLDRSIKGRLYAIYLYRRRNGLHEGCQQQPRRRS